MAKITFGGRRGGGRPRPAGGGGAPPKSVDEVIQEIRKSMEKPPGEDYREKSLAIHGLICGRCGREFDHTNRHLLTVHHRDGNHHNNPPDGSNWENLCVYCHDDVHSRSVLGEYVAGGKGDREGRLVHKDEGATGSGLGNLGDMLKKALKEKP